MTFDYLPLAISAAKRSRATNRDFVADVDKAIPRPLKVVSALLVLVLVALALASLAATAPALAGPADLAQAAKKHVTQIPGGAEP